MLYTGENGSSPTSSSSTAARSRRSRHHVDDVAKRLIDFGFHAPTMSFPGRRDTDDRADRERIQDEIDRFCEAMIAIHEKIRNVKAGEWMPTTTPCATPPTPLTTT